MNDRAETVENEVITKEVFASLHKIFEMINQEVKAK